LTVAYIYADHYTIQALEDTAVDLFFSPMACSLASRITAYEAGIQLNFIEVDPATKRTLDGGNYLEIYPLGLVPALRLEDGSLLTENAAILQYLVASSPSSNLAPTSGLDLARLHQWLCFVGTELHKATFIPLFDRKAPEGTRFHTLAKAKSRLDHLNGHLTGRQFLLDCFTVADAYLCSVLNWTAPTNIDLIPWPAIKAYHDRLLKRPSVSRATAEEWALYEAEVARHRAA
jgi:glutathione S-transferase